MSHTGYRVELRLHLPERSLHEIDHQPETQHVIAIICITSNIDIVFSYKKAGILSLEFGDGGTT